MHFPPHASTFRRSGRSPQGRRERGFNISFSCEIENFRRFLPPCFAKNSGRFCKKGHIALRYGPFCVSIWPILEAGKPLLARQKQPFWSRKGLSWGLKKLHTGAYETYKSYKANKLQLHTHAALICGQRIFIFKFAKIQRSHNAEINN